MHKVKMFSSSPSLSFSLLLSLMKYFLNKGKKVHWYEYGFTVSPVCHRRASQNYFVPLLSVPLGFFLCEKKNWHNLKWKQSCFLCTALLCFFPWKIESNRIDVVWVELSLWQSKPNAPVKKSNIIGSPHKTHIKDIASQSCCFVQRMCPIMIFITFFSQFLFYWRYFLNTASP